MINLGTLGGDESYGTDINASGQVVGYSRLYDGGFNGPNRAFLYTGTPGSGGTMANLGTLGPAESYAYALNDRGQVTGWTSVTSSVLYHAFLYTGTPGNGGTMVDLGTLGGVESVGLDINTAGQIVGRAGILGNEDHAFLYTGTPGIDGKMIDLDAWLDTGNPTEGSKWTLLAASGISDFGLITGYGWYDDGPGGLSDGDRAFLLDASALIPEPTNISLLAISSLALLRRRRPRASSGRCPR